MTVKSAGILLYRIKDGRPEFFLVHPGGPFWAKKDLGAWSIPKGEFNEDEQPLDAAIREFSEETGQQIKGNFISLTPVKLKSGKIIHAYALEHDFDPSTLRSNTFTLEWPPKSGKEREFPETDRGEWFDLATSKIKLNSSQVNLVEELADLVKP